MNNRQKALQAARNLAPGGRWHTEDDLHLGRIARVFATFDDPTIKRADDGGPVSDFELVMQCQALLTPYADQLAPSSLIMVWAGIYDALHAQTSSEYLSRLKVAHHHLTNHRNAI